MGTASSLRRSGAVGGVNGAHAFNQSGIPAANNRARPRGVADGTEPVACARKAS
jgi:hypothetical protein